MAKPRAIVCDIHNTLVDDDKNKKINNTVDFLKHHASTYKIILLTARVETERQNIINQMRQLEIPFDLLIMKPTNLNSSDDENKAMKHGIWKATELIKLQEKYDIAVFIDNNEYARKEAKKINIRTKKPENIKNKILTKNYWSGTFI